MRKGKTPDSDLSILLVDDEPEALDSLRPLLEREGHRVLTATSGAGALELFAVSEIHLLVVDYHMPGMGGPELIQAIRALDPFVQIIVQTGFSGQAPPAQVTRQLDIQGYHDKADGPEKLLTWIAVCLRAHGLLQTLKEREQAYAELVANVSHEIRTPLNIVTGYSDLLVDGELGDVSGAAMQVLGRIRAAALGLTDLVNDFLQYAKVEHGVVELAADPIDAHSIGTEISRLLELVARAPDLRFSVKVTVDGGSSRFSSDALKLRTILRNLVSNAVKYTDRGEIEVTFRVAEGRFQATVRDTGTGIRSDELELIFQPFRQARKADPRGGLGLGLALARKYALLLGGTLSVETEVGSGSTFTLEIPVAPIADHAIPASRLVAGA